LRIGIIGCGVAGQAAAIGLARAGHDVSIFERFPQARPLGAGLLLQPSGLAALDCLGLRSDVERWGAPVERLDGRTTNGRKVLDLHYKGEQGLGVHRATLFRVLHEALIASQTRLVLNFETHAIENPAAPALISADGRREGPFDLVINAAGAHDRLRHSLGGRVRDPLYPWGALWATCSDRSGAFARALRQVYRHCDTMIGILPVGRLPESDGEQVAFFWSLPLSEYDAQKALGIDALRKKVVALWPAAEPIVSQIPSFDEMSLATYRDVSLQPIRHGRVVTIGDAAHGTSPQLGQGANLSLIDAVTLTHCVRSSADIARALEDYERKRRRHVAFYRTASRWLTPVFQSNSRAVAFARDMLMAPGRHLPGADYLMRTTLSGVRCLPWGLWRLPTDQTPAAPAARPEIPHNTRIRQ